MTNIHPSNTSDEQGRFLRFFCPNCNTAVFEDESLATGIPDDGQLHFSLTCPNCDHRWEGTAAKRDKTSALVITGAEPMQLGDRVQSGIAGAMDTQGTVMIPRPIFWLLIAGLIIGIAGAGYFWGQFQKQRTDDRISEQRAITQMVIQATGTAEAKMTATANAFASQSTATANAMSRASTATTEAKAVNATSTTRVQNNIATATAERHSAIIATSTAHAVLVQIHATSTSERRATSTAEARATQAIKETQTAQVVATATAQQAATLAVRATATVQSAATATAVAKEVPLINVRILGCNTGFDIWSGRTEVTNAWVTLENVGLGYATNVKATLSSNDEEGIHPNKTDTVEYFPPNGQITFLLTVDTAFSKTSFAKVTVEGDGGIFASDFKAECKNLDANATKLIENAGDIGMLIIKQTTPLR